MSRSTPLVFSMVITLALCRTAPMGAQSILVVKLFSAPHAPQTQTTGINDEGTIVGFYEEENYVSHGFVRDRSGALTAYDAPGSTNTYIEAITTAGDITGAYEQPDGYRGFLRDASGEFTNFAIPGSSYTFPNAINSSRVITGAYRDGNTFHGFVRSETGILTAFDVPESVSTLGAGINDDGIIVGDYGDATGISHAYTRSSDGKFTTFDVPGSTNTYATAINSSGAVVGYSVFMVGATPYLRGYLRDHAGSFTTIDLPSAETVLYGINQEGDVSGAYRSIAGWVAFVRYKDGKTVTFALPSDSAQSYAMAINSSRTVAGYSVGQNFAAQGFVSQPPSSIDFGDGFSSANGVMNFNGSATLDGSQLLLTNGAESKAASAFFTMPVDIQSFATDFSFSFSDAVADGLTFTIQSKGAAALGDPGGGLGYQGIGKSVAIKFDLHNNSGEGANSTGLYINGASPTTPAIDFSHAGIDLHRGDAMNVHIAYNTGLSWGELALTITDQITNATWSNSFAVDIPGTVGGPVAYVGFTAATGEETSTLKLTSWTYKAGGPMP